MRISSGPATTVVVDPEKGEIRVYSAKTGRLLYSLAINPVKGAS